MLTFVTATRLSQDEFLATAPLGRCLRRIAEFDKVALRLSYNNAQPLADCYNAAIDLASPGDLLVFVHDDVQIDDWMVSQRLQEALAQFDVVGVAGNRRIQPGQVTWYLRPPDTMDGAQYQWDHPHLSGAIVHGTDAQAAMSVYGPAPSPVRLLDGVFIAARADRLKASGVRFDPRLGFHFYDLDFCRSAHVAGLRLGTWPIALTHASGGGSVRSAAWDVSRQVYLNKWGS